MKSNWAAAALVVALSCSATAQVAILQIQIIEGEGGVYAPGARSARLLTLEVTDETGRPVSGAAVTFRLPENGPSGTFANGMRTNVATTDERGRVSLRGLQFNRTPGKLEMRIIASKEQAHAGIVSFQYIAEAAKSRGAFSSAKNGGTTATSPTMSHSGHGRAKWIAIAAAVGGGAAAGLVLGRSHNSAAAPASTPGGVVSIGAPSITVGKP